MICIIGSLIRRELRGPQKFAVQFAKWLSANSIRGILVRGSLKSLVEITHFDDLSIVPFEEEEPGLFKYIPSIVFSLLFSILSLLKIIHANKRHRLSVIHAQDTNYCAMAAIAIAKIIHVPVVLHVHGINTNVIRLLIRPEWLEKSIVARLYRAYYLFLQKQTIRRSSFVICVSEDTKRRLPDVGKKVVIPMAVDTEGFEVNPNPLKVRETLRIPEAGFTLGYLGALSREKRLHRLLEAFSHFVKEMSPDTSAYLLIVGEGPERRNLEELAKRLEIRQCLRFTGFRKDVAKLLSAADVFVFPSESEGSPIALLEAMAARKAIIASNIPAIREVVRDGEEAILIDPQDVLDLKRAIVSVYSDVNLRAELAHKARARATRYVVDRVYGQIVKLFEEVIVSRKQDPMVLPSERP